MMSLVECFSEIAPTITSFIAILAAPFAAWIAFHRFYEDQVYFRGINRLNKLETSIKEDKKYAQAIRIKKREEAAFLLFGIREKPLLREHVLELYLEGKVDSKALRSSIRRLKIDGEGQLTTRSAVHAKVSDAAIIIGFVVCSLAMLIVLLNYIINIQEPSSASKFFSSLWQYLVVVLAFLMARLDNARQKDVTQAIERRTPYQLDLLL